jgi:hypothetical protein
MSGINRSRAAGKSRGRGTDDDITRPTTSPETEAPSSDQTGQPEDTPDSHSSPGSGGLGAGNRGGDEGPANEGLVDQTPANQGSDDPGTGNQGSDDQAPSASTKGTSRGRPSTIRSPHRTTVTLEEDHVDFLDNAAARIKLAGGEKLSRGAIIRALLSAMMESDLDLAAAGDEDRLRRLLAGTLANPSDR